MYAYIERAYGKIFNEGDKVMHTVTKKCGEVKKPDTSRSHYVRVHFGMDGLGFCHPGELEIIENKETPQ